MATAVHTYTDETKVYISSTTLTLKAQPQREGVAYSWHTEVLQLPILPESQPEREAEAVSKRTQAHTAQATTPAKAVKPKSASAMLTDFMASERYHSATNRQNAAVAAAAATSASAGSAYKQSTKI